LLAALQCLIGHCQWNTAHSLSVCAKNTTSLFDHHHPAGRASKAAWQIMLLTSTGKLAELGRMRRVIKYFAKSLKLTQGRWK